MRVRPFCVHSKMKKGAPRCKDKWRHKLGIASVYDDINQWKDIERIVEIS